MAGKRATIIYNPMSGRPGRRADDAAEMARLLGERGIQARLCATEAPDDATRLAREAVASGVDVIISYGGDGTLNEVIQAMAGSRVALAVWAGGTANVVARDLELPSDIKPLADVIAKGKTRRIALGLATGKQPRSGTRAQSQELENAALLHPSEIKQRALAQAARPLPTERPSMQRYFFMFAGIGLDASIARGVSPKLKRRTGELAFWMEGIKHLLTWQPELFDITVDGEKYEGVFALVGNGKSYGGGISITPNAKLDEPWFEVYILPRLSNNFAYLRDLSRCMRGNPAATSATIVRGKHVTANSTREPWVELDGEIIGQLPMKFDVVPDALSVIVPR